jgi:hypothetical protein
MVNRVAVVFVLAFLVAFIVATTTKSQHSYLIVGVLATIGLLPTFLALKGIQSKREGFAGQTQLDDPLSAVGGQYVLASVQEAIPVKAIEGREDTLPFQGSVEEVRNPFHNITIDQYSYAPTRDPAPSLQTPEAKEDLDAMFRVQWTSDPTDVFGKTQSQRMFVTQPITSIPNDQKSYQDWLYKIPGKTCKEGNGDACYGGTNGASVPWLNM